MEISDLKHIDLVSEESQLQGGFSFNFADALSQVTNSPSGISANADALALAQGFNNVYTNTFTFASVFNGPVNFGLATAFSISFGVF